MRVTRIIKIKEKKGKRKKGKERETLLQFK